MPNKQLITVPLNELRSSDVETIGSIFERDGKTYQWVKNSGATSLIGSGVCITRLTSVEAGVGCRVISTDGAGVSTGLVVAPHGVPVTAIGPSGSTVTGDHGWVQVKGYTTVRFLQSSVGTQQTIGGILVATNTYPATGIWSMVLADTADSATTSYHYAKRLVLMGDYVASTGPSTFITGVVNVQCM